VINQELWPAHLTLFMEHTKDKAYKKNSHLLRELKGNILQVISVIQNNNFVMCLETLFQDVRPA
jgi:hypothetical protein